MCVGREMKGGQEGKEGGRKGKEGERGRMGTDRRTFL